MVLSSNIVTVGGGAPTQELTGYAIYCTTTRENQRFKHEPKVSQIQVLVHIHIWASLISPADHKAKESLLLIFGVIAFVLPVWMRQESSWVFLLITFLLTFSLIFLNILPRDNWDILWVCLQNQAPQCWYIETTCYRTYDPTKGYFTLSC